MRKRKLKISLHRIRETKGLRMILVFVTVYPLHMCVKTLTGTIPFLEGDSA